MSKEYDRESREDLARYWQSQLDHAEKTFKAWQERSDKIVERYRDERDAVEKLRTKFNILWSNIQVLQPALYGRSAKPEVSRRYMDRDPIGRVAATILERALEYEVQQFPDYDAAMRHAVEDRLLPGRGVAWIRYEPLIVQEQLEAPEGIEITNSEEMTVERIDSAHSPVDYVYWKDFCHSPARCWDEVWWVARWVYMTRDEGLKRFGEVFNDVMLDVKSTQETTVPKPSVTPDLEERKAKIAEIWDKRKRTVCWLAKSYPKLLDERPDPLELEGFFPCPKPLFATTTTGTLIPVPDYYEYEDQARELDSVTGRITQLVKAIKAVGVYNAEYKELARLLTEGIDNKLFPVSAWAALSEKGGLKGAVDMLDLTTMIQALTVLYKAREDIKQTIYEIMGISDILRGATKPQETLGAQQLKANFGSLRLRSSQAEVARFATDLFRIKAQIICKFYPANVIADMSGIRSTPEGQNPQMLQQALMMLSNSTIRDFHIAVESDSLAQIDDLEEKDAAKEAIAAIGGFMKEAIPMVAQAPETLPMVSELLLFLVRRYRAGRALESTIERSMAALQQKAAQMAANPRPSPEEIEAQARMQADQMRTQADMQAAQAKAQLEAQVQQGKLRQEMELERLKTQQAAQLAKLEGQIKLAISSADNERERWKAQLEAATQVQCAQISAEAKKQPAASPDGESLGVR